MFGPARYLADFARFAAIKGRSSVRTCDHLEAPSPDAYCCEQVWGIHIEVAGATFYPQARQ